MNAETPVKPQLVTLTIDGRNISVPKGTTVYTAITQLGIDVPIFCYQDRMPPFGACRVCLVEVEKVPKLQTSCTLEATEGMIVKTQSDPAVEGRKGILEFLLINHPLDCPICDRGGECPLQEQTLHFGPGHSRFYEEKRHFVKPLSLGPVLKLDRERCIVCARCTRFGEIIAGDNALEFKDRGYRTEVGTPHEGPAESKFIGNTIMICPVGALTSEVYRFRARPWDNQPTLSTCPLCPVGCSLILDERDGEIVRTRSAENRNVNDIWLCDKGWFGYEFTSHPDRLTTPLIRRNGVLEAAGWEEAIDLVASKIKQYRPKGKLAGLGGNPLTTEECYLFQKLIREGCGTPHVDYRVGMSVLPLEQEGLTPGMEMTLGDAEELSFAVLLGLDLTEEFPVIWLRLKQAINKGAKVYSIGHFAPETARHLTGSIVHPPGKEVDSLKKYLSQWLASAGKDKKGALFIGRQYLNSINRKNTLAEILNLKKDFASISINIMEGEGNSMGARLAGMHPELVPQNQKALTPGLNFLNLIKKITQENWDFLYIAGANPQFNDQARSHLQFLVVQDIFLTETAQQADVVLPVLTFVEKSGTFINIEGRLQKLLPGKNIPDNIYSDGDIFARIAQKLNLNLSLDSSFREYLNRTRIILRHPTALSINGTAQPVSNGLKATFAKALFDHGVRMKHDPHVIQLSKEPVLRIHPEEAKKRNIKDEMSVRITSQGRSLIAKVKLDPKVAEETVVIPLGYESIPAYAIEENLMNGTPVEIETALPESEGITG